MAKALLISDLHIHNHKNKSDRLQDCLQVLKWAFEETLKNNCQYFLFLGDLFQERAKIDVLNYLRTYEVFAQYKDAPFEVYLLVGNHDMYHKELWGVNSVKPLTSFDNFHIVESPKTINIGNRNIDFLPFTDRPVEALKELKQGRDKKDLTLLLGHMAVHGAVLNTLYGTTADVVVEYDSGMSIIDKSVFDDWDMTILGHYHGAQNLSDNVEYLGSPLQLSFGEAFQEKHIAILDLDTLEKEYIINDFSPKHYILPKDSLSLYSLDNAFVRVIIDKHLSVEDLADLKTSLVNKVASLDFKMKEKKEEDQVEIEEARSILFKQDEMLKAWIKASPPPDGVKEDKLLEIWNNKIVVES